MVLCIAKYKFYYIYLQYNETNTENRLIPLDMKKTIHVNIGGMPFVLDEDAYDALKRYLSEIEIRLDGVDDQETMQDIETRIADIFSDAISPRVQVVDTALVKRAIAVIGPAQEFGEPRRSMPGHEQTGVRNDEKHLYRSRRDRVVGGVCGGIAEYSSLDATLLRVLMALFIVFGVGLLVYLVMWIVIPNEPRSDESNEWGRK